MATQQGCKFCTRYGLPILPVRSAVVSKQDALPVLPASINVLAEAQGETAWTGRLLREGFLYIWSESGNRWINYFATSSGYYYPLPENGDVPPDIASGKTKPCITHPSELASASLITLPVKPAGMKNGLFWFSWSEVEWTPAVREKHEDAGYRSQYMQCFDMDAWVNAGKADQVLSIQLLKGTVAEYSNNTSNCTVTEWSVSPWKKVKPQEGENLLQAAENLYPGKGAMILLQDPPAVLQDLSALINTGLQQNIYEKPDYQYQRELALTATITNLKESLTRQFERDFLDKVEMNERMAIYGGRGAYINGSIPENIFPPSYYEKNKAKMKAVVAEKWSQYEQYYDPGQVTQFQRKFETTLTDYNNKFVVPREEMYLTCIKHPHLTGYCQHNFDISELNSGIDYVQTINYCITGMQDKLGVAQYFLEQLSGKVTDNKNIMARALVLNQDTLASKLNEGVEGSVDLYTLPWSFIADAFRSTIERVRNEADGVMGIYFGLLAGPLTKKMKSFFSQGEIFHSLVAMGVFSNKAIVPYQKTGTYKEFVSAVVNKLGQDSDLTGKVKGDQLRHYVTKELRRLSADGLPIDEKEIKNFLVMIDIDKVKELKILPPKERAIAVSKLLRTANNVEGEQLASWRSVINASTNEKMPFAFASVSLVLQTVALVESSYASSPTLTSDQKEATYRFGCGVAAAISALAGVVETAIKGFNVFQAGGKLRVLSSAKFLRGVEIFGKFFGVIGGLAAAVYDSYHAYDEMRKGHKGLAILYGLSAASGIWLTAALLFTVPIIGTMIATILLVATAIFLAINSQEPIQKWLEQCLWRKIPTSSKAGMEYEEANLPIWPTFQMEVYELKIALGEA